MLPSTIPPLPERMFVPATNLENRLDTGIIAFSRYFRFVVASNGWSHAQLVSLCKLCTDQKAWLHNSQIAGLLKASFKNPGPRSFMALEFLFRAIDQYQKSDKEDCGVKFGKLTPLIEHAVIMRDENGNPATLGYLVEVFAGLRDIPIDISTFSFSDKQASLISDKAGRLIRRLMAVESLDPIVDAEQISVSFGQSKDERNKFVAIIKGSGQWKPDEIEDALTKLSKLMRERFNYKRSSRELQEEFLATPRE